MRFLTADVPSHSKRDLSWLVGTLTLLALCACGQSRTGPDASACGQATAISNDGTPTEIVLDDTFVYWIDTTGPTQSALARTPKAGGQTDSLAGSEVSEVAVDVDNIYYMAAALVDGGYVSTIYSLPKAGGAPNALATGRFTAINIAVDDTSVYFASQGSIMSVAKTGGTPLQLNTTSQPEVPLGIAGVDDTTVYWWSGSFIWATLKVGGANTQLTQGQSVVGPAVLDGADIYFRTLAGDITDLSLATMTTTTLASNRSSGLLAVRSGTVFFNDKSTSPSTGPDKIYTVPTDGGAVQATCASTSMFVTSLAVDDATIYWGTNVDTIGSLMKIAR